MDEIIYRQKNAPRPMTARRFLLGVAGIVLRLALAQLIALALESATGSGLFSILFYLYAVALLLAFMRRTVASSAYTLKRETLTLQSLMGDSTTSVVEIELSRIVALREVRRGENLRATYPQVTAIDAAAKPGPRMRAAFLASLLSARLARRIAGGAADHVAGYAAIFEEDGFARACVFRPNEEMRSHLRAALPDAFGVDDRLTREPLRTITARALQRAFPAYYPHVEPLVGEEELQKAQDEIARQKRERQKKKRARNGKAAETAPAQDAPSTQDASNPEETTTSRRRRRGNGGEHALHDDTL